MTPKPLTGRETLRFYFPLALSWLFMGLEWPVCIKLISNLPNAAVNTAAFSVMMSVSLWIESPVIDLLSTSTTLGRDRARFALISRFVWCLMAWVTFAHVLVTFTPLYGVVMQGMLGVSEGVAESARPGMMILSLWSAFIGWRRSLQGMLIRNGQTRVIGIGTALRVGTIVASSLMLYRLSHLNGLMIAATALMISVATECMFVHIVSRRTVRSVISQPPIEGLPSLSMGALAKFHFPLTATTMVKLLVTPIIIAGLARTSQPILAIAAYQVAGTIIFMHRALGFCLPEVVIALYRDEQSRQVLKRFCSMVAIATSGSMLVLALTGLDRVIFMRLLNASPEVSDIAHWMFLLSALSPALDATQSYVRGVLTAHHLTVSRLVAVAISVGVALVAVQIGVATGWPAPAIAGVAMTVSLMAELLALVVSWSGAQSKGGLSAVH